MKGILLPMDQSERMLSALDTARLAANLFDSTVEGVALRPAFAEFVAGDSIAIAMPPPDWNETEYCRTLCQTFGAYAAQHPMEQNERVRFRWRGGSTIADPALGAVLATAART